MTDIKEEKKAKATESRQRTRALNKKFGDCSTAYALFLLKETPSLAQDHEENDVVMNRVLSASDPVKRTAWVAQYRQKKNDKKQAKEFVPRVAELAKAVEVPVEVPVAKELPGKLTNPRVTGKAKAIANKN